MLLRNLITSGLAREKRGALKKLGNGGTAFIKGRIPIKEGKWNKISTIKLILIWNKNLKYSNENE